MTKTMIDVVLVPHDTEKPVALVTIDRGHLAGFQALVGGPIELVRLDPGNGVLFNEEGLGDGLPYNDRVNDYMDEVHGLDNGGLGYYGDAVFIGLPPGEEFGSATEAMTGFWQPTYLVTIADVSGQEHTA